MTKILPLNFAGVELHADLSGILYYPAEETLIVSDLHLEKGSSFAAQRRVLLPPYDTRQTLLRLRAVIEQYQPRRVVSLGDSFHDRDGSDRLVEDDETLLRNLIAGRDWIWIVGNHDPQPPAELGGTIAETMRLGPLCLRHETDGGRFEISGHYHPKAAVVVRSNYLSARCFAIDEHRMILPAFGAYTGGLNVLSPAIRKHFLPDFNVVMLGKTRVTILPSHRLTFSRY